MFFSLGVCVVWCVVRCFVFFCERPVVILIRVYTYSFIHFLVPQE